MDKSYAETPEYIVNGTHYLYYDPMLAAEKGNKELNEAFIRSVNDIELYNEYELPKRGTKAAGGYDFYALYDYILNCTRCQVFCARN